MSSTREETQPKPGKKAGRLRFSVLIAGVVGLLVAARLLGLGDKLQVFQDWVAELGPLGPIVFVLIYIGATIAMIPGTALTLFAGVLFGSILGTVCVSVGSTIGASLCFLISRYLARDTAKEWLSKRRAFVKLDRLTESQGQTIVAITRLVPIFPFNLLNYGFGLTRVNFGTYVLWSWLCMLPMTILFVVGGEAGFKVLSEGDIPPHLIGVAIFILVLLAIVVRNAKKRLNDEESTPDIDKD
ncbi:TVP38/TMEM64 family protein [Candidatus Hydrogenedentota bacterium]